MAGTEPCVIARAWQDADTAQAWTWFQAQPDLWRLLRFPGPVTWHDWTAHVAHRCEEAERAQAMVGAVDVNGELAGYVTLAPRIGSTGIAHIVVNPAYRGSGTAIARAALQYAADHGVTRILAFPAPGIPDAIHERWIRAIGFDVKHFGEWRHG